MDLQVKDIVEIHPAGLLKETSMNTVKHLYNKNRPAWKQAIRKYRTNRSIGIVTAIEGNQYQVVFEDKNIIIAEEYMFQRINMIM